MNKLERIEFLTFPNCSCGEVDIICRLVASGKSVMIAPQNIAADNGTYPGFSVVVRDESGNTWESPKPSAVLVDVLSQAWKAQLLQR